MTKSNLPKGWRFRYGAYRYRVPVAERHLFDNKAEFKLGNTEAKAWRTWYERTGSISDEPIKTMDELFDEWWCGHVLLYLAETTQESYEQHLKPLRKAFGHMRPGAISTRHAYPYRDKRSQKARVSANREVSVLSSALMYAVERGYLDSNPLRGQITRRGAAAEKPRDRVPSTEELAQFCEINPHLTGWVLLKSITGMRQGEMLRINLNDHWDGKALTPPTSKGSKKTSYEGTALEDSIAFILNGRLPRGSLFITKTGQPRKDIKSIWRRAMNKYVAQGGLKFNEHDIRSFVASEASTLEEARKLLRHQESKTTARIYRVGKEQVQVLGGPPNLGGFNKPTDTGGL